MSSNILLNKFLHTYNKNKNNKIFQTFLFICSIFFLFVYKVRLLLYKLKVLKTYSLEAYIISIGNLTSGGTGKTPLTIEAAKHFLSLGKKVAVLSRGYNSKSKGEVILVSDGTDLLADYEHCGDEAYLIAKKVPKAIVFSGKDRIKSAKSAIKLGAEVLILDDGFQYLKLTRNQNILVIDSYNPFDNECLLPQGKLRELPDSIKRATGIIISNSNLNKLKDKDFDKIRKNAQNISLAKIFYKITELISLNTKRILNIKDTKGLNVIACCGIGNPQSFLDLLKRNEINVESYLIYPDHHRYIFSDIEQMVKLAKKYNIENIVTTEKDAVKIESLCEAIPVNFWAVKIDILWETANLFKNSPI